MLCDKPYKWKGAGSYGISRKFYFKHIATPICVFLSPGPVYSLVNK